MILELFLITPICAAVLFICCLAVIPRAVWYDFGVYYPLTSRAIFFLGLAFLAEVVAYGIITLISYV